MRFASPRARLDESRWLADAGASAAIDVSDGLGADLTHLARASGVSIELEAERLPCIDGVSSEHALSSGEEYELVVTFPPSAAPQVNEFETRFALPLTLVGTVRAPSGEPVRIAGSRVDPARGHDHLS